MLSCASAAKWFERWANCILSVACFLLLHLPHCVIVVVFRVDKALTLLLSVSLLFVLNYTTKPLFLAFFTAFSLLPENLTARIGFPARLDCQTNITNGFIRWARGADHQMINAATCTNCTRLSNYSLYFQRIDQSHGGRYTCVIVGLQYRVDVYLTVAG